jgi:prefoldin subunit 5
MKYINPIIMSSPNARIAELLREIAEIDANNTYTAEEKARNAEKDAIIAKLIIKIAETDARTAKLNEETKALNEEIKALNEMERKSKMLLTVLNEMVRKSEMLLPQGCSRQAFF